MSGPRIFCKPCKGLKLFSNRCLQASLVSTSQPVHKALHATCQIPQHYSIRHSSSTSEHKYASCTKQTFAGISGHAAVVSINNPSKLNILNSTALIDLTATFHTLSASPDLRVIVLRGSPPSEGGGKPSSFCAGADLHEMSSLQSPTEAETFIRKISSLCGAIRTAPVPVIAQIDGFCFGAGLEVAAACDWRVASRRSEFAMPEVKVGIPSVVEARLLVDLIGWGRTRRLLMMGEKISCETALSWGLVEASEVESGVGVETLMETHVQAIMTAGPKAVRSQKALIRKWEEVSVDEGIEAGVHAFANMWMDGSGEEPRTYMKRAIEDMRNSKLSRKAS